MRLMQGVQPEPSKMSRRRMTGKVCADRLSNTKTHIRRRKNQTSEGSRRLVEANCRAAIKIQHAVIKSNQELACRESRFTRKQKTNHGSRRVRAS